MRMVNAYVHIRRLDEEDHFILTAVRCDVPIAEVENHVIFVAGSGEAFDIDEVVKMASKFLTEDKDYIIRGHVHVL